MSLEQRDIVDLLANARALGTLDPLKVRHPRHGNLGEYTNYYGCRCGACREAMASYQREYQRARRRITLTEPEFVDANEFQRRIAGYELMEGIGS